MKNLYHKKDYQSILVRFNSITPASESLWGRMDVHQMIIHLKDQFDIALGNKTAKAQGPLILKTVIGRWMALYILPWGKGSLSAPKEMDALNNGTILTDFESDKHLLLCRLKEFIAAPGFKSHPFFGQLRKRAWGRLAYKHINHHLLQFGA